MDWYLVGFTIAGSWVALLVAGDIAALLNVPLKRLALIRNISFFVAVAMAISFGFALAGEHHGHGKPCPPKGASR